MKLSTKQLHKKNAGFTLTEMLVVVALIAILMAVAFVGVGKLRRNLRQRELDSKAEVIYMAAQSRITQLRTGGFADLYGKDQDGVHKDIYPLDAEENSEDAKDLCYVLSEENADTAYVLLPESSVEQDLWMHSWLIEFNPNTGSIYAVFYSEESIAEHAGSDPMSYLDALRVKSERLEAGAWVGYYGGDLTHVDVVDPDAMKAEVVIVNNEKLTAYFYCYTLSTEKPDFTVTITDSAGNKYVKQFAANEISQDSGTKFSASWVLDSLADGGSFYTQTEGKLLCGTKIDVRLDTSLQKADGKRLTDKDIKSANSLFDNRSENAVAYIGYGRHLQNLDNNTSQVEKDKTASNLIRSAIQVDDISFLQNDADPECYYSVYGDRLFQPIHNSSLNSYVGQKIGADTSGAGGGIPAISGLHIETTDNRGVGLFSYFTGTIQDLLITGPQIDGDGSNVGVLVGSASGKTEISHVQVFLSDLQGDLDKAGVAGDVSKVKPWVQGRNVGGLIGSAGSNGQLTIHDSSVSLPMSGTRYVGGLVGMVNCPVNIYKSYTDCYLTGRNAAGLIGGAGGRASINLQNFYTAGYGLADSKAAGWVVFGENLTTVPLKNATNGYSAMSLALTEEDEDADRRIYTTADDAAAAQNAYFLPLTDPNVSNCRNAAVAAIDYGVLTGKDATKYLQDSFSLGTVGQTNPYNLMRQGLSTYSFPRFAGMTHYGDWAAEFEEGALVYFEKDTEGNLRFEGGNISVDNIQADDTLPDYQDRVRIVGDGYALAYLAKKDDSWSAKVTLGSSAATLTNRNCVTVTTQSGQSYYLYRLPADMLNNDSNVKEGVFYQQLTVSENKETRSYYFNPNFANCFGASPEGSPSVLHLRSPRHLYALSRLYPKYRGMLTAGNAVWQDLDLSYTQYDWMNYFGDAFQSQEPIGTETGSWFITYDGRNHVIEGLDIESTSNQVGLFGKVGSSGNVRNLVLIGESPSGTACSVAHLEKDSPMADGVKTVNMGALVGWNQGSISNCAVTGYRIRLAGYNGATSNIGGLVGRNEGGTISACSAETPSISLSSYNANIYAAGLVGDNSGSVYNSYAAGYLEVTESRLNKNTVRIAGFAAKNGSGNLIRCYSGAALMGSGDTEMYGFACTGGATISCYYLDGGTYEYRGKIYSLNASENAFRTTARGTVTDAEGLAKRKLDGFASSPNTYLGNAAGQTYPYPASLSRNGQAMHFGYWPNQDKDVGEFGVFYWEYEQGGNSGYHLSFQGTSNGQVMDGGSTLCTAHDDGGVITMYGYGFFYKPTANVDPEEDPKRPTLAPSNCVLGSEDTDASRELEIQMPQYKFVAYRTGTNGLHMTGKDANRDKEANRNATWTLYYPYVTKGTGVDTTKSGVYTYSVSPFFADAFSLDSISKADTGRTEIVTTGAAKPGSAGNGYEVRSVEQLQFINWNYWAENAASYISATDRSKNDSLYNCYPYLSYGKYGTNGNRPSAILDLYWVQSHDLDASDAEGTYTPIGGMYDNAGNTGDAQATMAFFSSSYDGQAYIIKNISIDTDAQCIGVFGATVGAKLKNIVLYSDNNAQIIHRDSKSWYSVGGLVGLAGSRDDPNSTFTNCTVSGYSILDVQATNPGWGGGCVGGMVGATTMKITSCSAVTDIVINIRYNGGYQNLRVGGLVGCARGSISECYAGGSIKSTSNISQGNFKNTANIWMGGILGGIVLRNGGNLASLIGSTTVVTTVSDSYSFVSLPARGHNGVMSAQAIASSGEMQEAFSPVANDYIVINNCYALESTAQNTEDYWLIMKEELRDTTTFRGLNLNKLHWVKGTGVASGKEGGRTWDWWERRIELNNDRNPYLSYAEMQKELFDYLPDFEQVTTTENTASINGKYSFPGSDAQLAGLDYPFPTILTQENNGETVHVHYGAWPKFGIYWQEHQATMDLLADRDTSTTGLVVGEPVEEAQEVTEEAALSAEETEAAEATEETEATQTTEETLELLALDADTLQATLPYRLYVAGVDTRGISAPVYTLLDQEGNEIPESEAGSAAASILSYDTTLSGDYFNITFLGQHPGTVKVLAAVTQNGVEYTALLTLTVTADLKIAVDETRLPLKTYEGDGLADLTVLLEDANGNAFRPGENAKLSWDLAIDTQDSLKDLVTWSKDAFLTANDDGTFTLTGITGFSAGEGALKLSLVYTWDTTDGVNADPVESTLVIPVVVHPSDVLGLGDGTANQEITLPHTPADGAFTSEARAEGEDGPKLESAELFLYASSLKDTDGTAISYTDLSAFDVEKAELKQGGSYQKMDKVIPDASESVSDTDDFTLGDITVRIDKAVVTAGTRNQDFTYRPVTVTGDSDAQWSLRLTLRPKSSDGSTVNRTYTLVYDRPNYVRFSFESVAESGTAQTPLKEIRVEQGQDLSKLDQDELDAELLQLAKDAGLDVTAGLEPGHHWTWTLPEDTVIQNCTILQKKASIRYDVAYDAGYDDYEWDDNVPMENSVFTYGSEDNVLKDCAYRRPGYDFVGWEAKTGQRFQPGDSFRDQLDNFEGGSIVHGQILTLHAVWTPAAYTISYNAGFETDQTMAASTYSIDADDLTLTACGFTREGYRFLGWAFEPGAVQAVLAEDATLEDAMKQGGDHILYQDVTLYAVWEQEEADQQDQEDTVQDQEELEEPEAEDQETLEKTEQILPEAPADAPEKPEDKKQEPAEEADQDETES